MRKRDVHPGLRVEITGAPYKGRTGVVRRKGRLGLLMPVWEIWCDRPDSRGRQLVRVTHVDLQPEWTPSG